MEEETAFKIIIGLIMVITVVIAAVAMMGGLLKQKISIRECGYEYVAKSTYSGANCGSIDGNAKCNVGDNCMDSEKNLCCPKDIEIIEDNNHNKICCKVI
jgi:hypothetical protein